ncbi:MAG: hypothetical protein ACRDGV_05790, partial [Candidatus Limnocylindria bacterium]
MIGARAAVAGAVAIGLVGGLFGQRSADARLADPVRAASAHAAAQAGTARAASALETLQGALDVALAAARRGGARIVSGEQPPSGPLREAASLLREA